MTSYLLSFTPGLLQRCPIYPEDGFMNTTYAIDNCALSAAEIELLVCASRRNPSARLHGREQAQRVTSRMMMALGTLATSVWAVNAYVVLSHHAH